MQPHRAFLMWMLEIQTQQALLPTELFPWPFYAEIFQLIVGIWLRKWTNGLVFQYSRDLFLLSVLLLTATDFMDNF